MKNISSNHISIIGGAGHVGLPLGLAFAEKKFNVHLIDTNIRYLNMIKNNQMPFYEVGAKNLLKKVNKKKLFHYESNLKNLNCSKYIIICIGTPINKNLKPDLKGFYLLINMLRKKIKKDQILIIRSSVLPGTNEKIKKILKNKNNNIVYGPERIVQSKSLIELPKLPQILACENKNAFIKSKNLFKKITKIIIETSILEAELIKLYSNANRYINFAIANQLYTLCHYHNLDFERIRDIMQLGYERNLNLTKAGLTAGPCLVKDTMQLKHFTKSNFELGSAAMKINERIPNIIIEKLKKIKNYKKKKIGVLGLAFKGETDDIRDSLSITLLNKLKKLKLKILQSDEYFKNKNNVSRTELITKSNIIIIGAPHNAYKKMNISKQKKIIDIWNII